MKNTPKRDTEPDLLHRLHLERMKNPKARAMNHRLGERLAGCECHPCIGFDASGEVVTVHDPLCQFLWPIEYRRIDPYNVPKRETTADE